MVPLVLILLGLCFGSFANAFAWRLHEKRNWVSERSECPHCHHILAPKDLVPVLSWLALRGKCRYCRKPIPDTPLPELATPALFVLSYIYWPQPLHGVGLFQFGLWLVFLVAFVVLAVYDIRWYLLPDKVVFPLMALAGVWVAGTWVITGAHGWRAAFGSAVGAAIISGLFFVLHQASKGKWIGFGDVKLGVVLGALAGGALPACLVLFWASCIGVLVSLPLVVAGKAGRKTQLPFGPLLMAGTVIAVLFGQGIVDWYGRLFHL
ncbi:MAG TPA: prepilin peptidase [Candidatus Saccharimonadales bacterium]|nr:prepilin peptidase [Candidatus Saccharimonadales bacterium]